MKEHREKILIIDQETSIFEMLAQRLTNSGYKLIFVSTGEKALTSFYTEKPDLVILDILLRNYDGYEICSKIREVSHVPIIILTALGHVQERIKGFEVGADDYIIKPFSPKELELRVNSVLRRGRVNVDISPAKTQNSYQMGDLKINFLKKTVFKNQKYVKLTKIEFLLFLRSYPVSENDHFCENGSIYENSDASFRYLRRFEFRKVLLQICLKYLKDLCTLDDV